MHPVIKAAMCPYVLYFIILLCLMGSAATQWIKQVEDASKMPCNIQSRLLVQLAFLKGF
jgi:hypothetical protein